MSGAKQLQVAVLSPEGPVFEGGVDAVSAVNKTGRFDVLPQHANFITIIEGKLLLHTQRRRQTREIEVKRGILYCHSNKVEVFLSVA